MIPLAIGLIVGYVLGLLIGRADRPKPSPGDDGLRREVELLRRDCIRWKRRALRRGWKPWQAWKKR